MSWTKYIVTGLIALAVAGPLYFTVVDTAPRTDDGVRLPSGRFLFLKSDRMVTLHFENRAVRIAQNYLSFLHEEKGIVGFVTLHATLPDLKPYSEETKNILGTVGLDRGEIMITVNGSNPGFSFDQQFDRFLMHFREPTVGEETFPGYVMLQFEGPGHEGERAYVNWDDKNIYRCRRGRRGAAVTIIGTCTQVNYDYPGIYLNVEFRDDDLPVVIENQSKIRQFLDNFLGGGAERRY